ncbi:DUF3558 domain-containing protein [Nocardia suismassiliense]|uniref:DUF3558 domain-containing protein n=1 Tax=Nocardia suismassiliense TaxID=2077092 RepID=UPI000D1EC0C9|nr:DUF3558 domain-containing protein [Nocardia suismassiliense]
MTSRFLSWKVSGLVLGAVFVLAGCGPSNGGGDTPTSSGSTPSDSKPGLTANVPGGYDPCTAIPQTVLDSENLRGKDKDDSNASGGVKWRGCAWIQTDGYAATIQTTNLTVDMVRDKNFRDARESTVSGRRAIQSRQVDDHPDAACTLNVEMKGGSLEFNLSNPPSRKNTGSIDTCQLTRALAEKVVPTMPTTV